MRAALIALLCSISFAPAAGAWATATRSVAMLVESPGREEQPWEELREAIEAHLSPHAVSVRLVSLDGRDPGAAARSQLDDPQVVAAMWLDRDEERLLLLVPVLGAEETPRAVPDGGEGWPARCEVLASILLSELEPLLAGMLGPPPVDALDPVRSETETEPMCRTTESETETETEPMCRTTESETEARDGFVDLEREPDPELEVDTPPPVRPGLGLAYLPVLLSPGTPYRSGIALTGVAWLGRHVEIDVGVDIVQPCPLGLESGGGELARWTLRIAAAGIAPAGRLDLGFAVGSVVEFARVRDLGYAPLDPGALDRRTHGGLLLATRIRVRPVPWFALYAELGADMFFQATVVSAAGTELLRRTPVQPRIAVGVMGLLARR